MVNVGLTGGIGSGKSTVARFLRELGATVIDADRVGHEIYLPGKPAYDEVVAAFGREIVASDGTIDRKRLGAIVFAEVAALRRLEAIVHPRIFATIKERIAQMRAQGATAPIVVEAAILAEAGWQGFFDQVWLVIAPLAAVLQRVQAERGLSPEQIEARIQAQMPVEERRKRATLVIDNSGSIEELRAKVERHWRDLLARDGA